MEESCSQPLVSHPTFYSPASLVGLKSIQFFPLSLLYQAQTMITSLPGWLQQRSKVGLYSCSPVLKPIPSVLVHVKPFPLSSVQTIQLCLALPFPICFFHIHDHNFALFCSSLLLWSPLLSLEIRTKHLSVQPSCYFHLLSSILVLASRHPWFCGT